MNTSVKTSIDQALTAYYNLMILFDKINLDIKCKLPLFVCITIVPIFLYSSEVWGIYKLKGGYLDFSHLIELKNTYITDIYMEKQYKSPIIKNHKITKENVLMVFP